MKIPPCLVLTRVSVSNMLTRTHHLFLVLFFIYLWLLRFFILTFFFFYSFGFQSRCLHPPSAEHTNSFPIETPSLSKFCCCLCTCKIYHSATYSQQNNIAAFRFIFFIPATCFQRCRPPKGNTIESNWLSDPQSCDTFSDKLNCLISWHWRWLMSTNESVPSR